MLYTSYEFKGLKDGEVYVGLDHYYMYTSNNVFGVYILLHVNWPLIHVHIISACKTYIHVDVLHTKVLQMLVIYSQTSTEFEENVWDVQGSIFYVNKWQLG